MFECFIPLSTVLRQDPESAVLVELWDKEKRVKVDDDTTNTKTNNTNTKTNTTNTKTNTTNTKTNNTNTKTNNTNTKTNTNTNDDNDEVLFRGRRSEHRADLRHDRTIEAEKLKIHPAIITSSIMNTTNNTSSSDINTKNSKLCSSCNTTTKTTTRSTRNTPSSSPKTIKTTQNDPSFELKNIINSNTTTSSNQFTWEHILSMAEHIAVSETSVISGMNVAHINKNNIEVCI